MVESEVLGGPAGGRALEVARDEFSFLLTRVVPADVLSPPLFFLLSAGIGLSPTRSRVLFGSLVAVCPSQRFLFFFVVVISYAIDISFCVGVRIYCCV